MEHPRIAFVVAALSLALPVAACSSDGDSAATTTVATTTTTSAPSTGSTTTTSTSGPSSTAPPTTAPSTSAPATLPSDGQSWASALVRAWGAGDRAEASRLATSEVVDVLFDHADPGGATWDLGRCEGAAGSIYCTFVEEASGETLVLHQANMPDEATGVLPPIDSARFGADG